MVLSAPPTRHLTKAAFDPLLAAADRAEPELRAAVTAALDELLVSEPALAAAVATGNTSTVLALLEAAAVTGKVRARIVEATVNAALTAGMPEAARFKVAFNEPNIRAIRWAEANTGKLIQQVSASPQRLEAIRDLIVVGIENGLHPSVTARTIRGLVPLTTRQAKTVSRLYRSSIDAGVNPAHASKIAARKAEKLRRYRAVMIARTEAIRAANQGQQLVWESARDAGYLPQNVTKVWLATGDSRTCTICEGLDGSEIALGDSFTFVVSPKVGARTERVPPAHPLCRCTMVLGDIPVPSSRLRSAAGMLATEAAAAAARSAAQTPPATVLEQ